jgi:hypothetical protein
LPGNRPARISPGVGRRHAADQDGRDDRRNERSTSEPAGGRARPLPAHLSDRREQRQQRDHDRERDQELDGGHAEHGLVEAVAQDLRSIFI